MLMSQVSKFNNKLAVSLALVLASSGAAFAQQAPADRPTVSYQATEATPPADAVPAAAPKKVVARKSTAKKPTRKAATEKSEASKPEEKMTFPAPRPGEIEVSDRDFNHFIFGSQIKQLVFPPGAAVVGKPVYLAENTQALVEVQRGADKPIQMIVETESGPVTKLYLKPRPIDGITYTAPGARAAATAAQAASKPSAPTSGAPHAEDIELLKRAVQGDIPGEFEAIALPRPTRFDRFTVVPIAGWSDGARRIMQFSLVAVPGKTAVVSNPQFYRPGISAVLLTGDHVDEESNPQLFVVEEVSNDE
jgi:hypothetical protein